jgi:hypothetical protein
MAQMGAGQNVLGISSVVAGLLSICCGPCLGGFGSGGIYLFELPLAIAALVLGILHLQRVKNRTATNRTLGVLGIVFGAVGLVLAICLGVSTIGDSFHNDVT